MFLGDAGSISLGFLAGGLGLAGWTQGAWPPWFPVLVFSPFIVDASLTLAVRLLRGNKPWQAHREHLYQRMVRSGLGHGRTAMLWYAVMIAAGVTAIAALSWPIGAQFWLLDGVDRGLRYGVCFDLAPWESNPINESPHFALAGEPDVAPFGAGHAVRPCGRRGCLAACLRAALQPGSA